MLGLGEGKEYEIYASMQERITSVMHSANLSSKLWVDNLIFSGNKVEL